MKTIAAFLLFGFFFWLANRGAYKGYFDGDDLDNLCMTNAIGADIFVNSFFSPKLDQANFRPVGHAFYRYFGSAAQLNYPRYIACIHAVHLINVILLWLLLRALGFEPLNAAFGLLFYAFNMGTFEIYWKPMYVFDLFCATFTLASILLWIRDRWILSFLAFWCAFKAKEVAIAIPVVLALLDYTLRKRRWKQLLPFLAVSLSFGLQAVLANHGPETAYTFHFTFDALKTCLMFYGNRILIVPYGAFIVAAMFFIPDRRARFGVAAILLFMAPMLFLPGRLFGAYLYVPLIGLSIAAAAFSHKTGRIASIVLALIWLPLNYRDMQHRRSEQLAIADQNHVYVNQVLDLVKAHPQTRAFIFDKSPEGLHSWGVRSGARWAIGLMNPLKEAEIRSKEALDLSAHEANLAYLIWTPETKKLSTVTRDAATQDIPYIAMNNAAPLWQLGDGWHGVEGNFEWTNLEAFAHIARPAGAMHFEVLINVGPLLIQTLKQVKLEVLIDGSKVGEQQFSTAGWRTLSFEVPPSKSPTAQVEFKASPGYFYEDHNPADALGIAIGGFGFPTTQYPSVPTPTR
ncbi:MAG TPA: hypothetical protein VGL53_22455 [Bryobacteraceae bacterium]|jgi:hypothetical protein